MKRIIFVIIIAFASLALGTEINTLTLLKSELAAGGSHTIVANTIGGPAYTLDANITFGANVGQTLTVVPIKTESIAMALTAAQAVGHDKTLAESAIFGADLTSPVTDRLDAAESITFAVSDTSTLTPGTTFTDEPIYTVSVGMTGATSFLWNEEDEVTTTWTKVDYPN